jgi:hypothetical protein
MLVQVPDGLADLAFRDRHRVAHDAPEQVEGERAHGPRQEPVGHALGVPQGARLPGRQRRGELGRTGRLDSDDLDRRGQREDRDRDAGDEPPTAHRHQDRTGVGPLLENLEADGSLASDHVRMIERRDQGQTLVPCNRLGPGPLLGRPRGSRQHHLTAMAPHTLDLHPGRRLGHHDHGTEAELARGERQCLAVVAARGRDHALRAASSHQPGKRMVGAADLEGTDRLEQFALERHGHAHPSGEIGRIPQRRAQRDAIQHAGGASDGVQGNGRGGSGEWHGSGVILSEAREAGVESWLLRGVHPGPSQGSG